MVYANRRDNPDRLIQTYDREMDAMAAMENPGQIRAAKGRLVEDLTQRIVRLAWQDAGGTTQRLSFGDTKAYPMPVQANYVANQPQEVVDFIGTLRPRDRYQAHVDQHVFVDGEFRVGIECKSYSENAMLKRILVDFWLLKSQHPDLVCCLLQLESQLTGDYSNLNADPRIGSAPTHTIMSYFPDIDLNIFTLLAGERRVNRPIHQPQHRKRLERPSLIHAIGRVSQLLRPFV